MFKIMKEEAPNYLMNLIPKDNQTIRTRNSHIPIFRCRKDCFKYSLFTIVYSSCTKQRLQYF